MSLDVYLMLDGEAVYHRNITHNLNKMAEAAGIYKHLWRPDEIGITKAEELLAPLLQGYSRLILERKLMEKHNASNGWGMYEHFLPFISAYIEACVMYPDATVDVSR